MKNDIIDEVRALRPEVEGLNRRWPAYERAELARRIRSDSGRSGRRVPRIGRRRAVAGSLLVAAAVAAAVALPSLLPSGAPGSASPAAAVALNRLAHVAAGASVETAGADQYRHLVVQETQFGTFDGSQQVPTTVRTTYNSWTGSKGQVWQRIGSEGETDFFPAHDGDATYLASLPTDPTALDNYLRSHAKGSNSTDEAVFVAIGDLLRGANVAATLRSAAVTVLARTDHVKLGRTTVDSHGRTVQQFNFVDTEQRPGQVESLFFDPHTAALLDERTTTPTSTDTKSVLVSEVVGSVPPNVLKDAVRQK